MKVYCEQGWTGSYCRATTSLAVRRATGRSGSNSGAVGIVVGALMILSSVQTTTASLLDGLTTVMRDARCLIPNGVEDTVRAALLQQCLSNNFAQGNETACYKELGCFPMDSPWTSELRPLPSPQHPAQINTHMYCYTREKPERQNITLWPKIDLEGCHFVPHRRTAFITHGYISSGNYEWVLKLKDNYLIAEDANVFVVDWADGALVVNYLQAASNCRIVGAEIARVIKWLVANKGVDLGNVHLVGESLGAQVIGYAGQGVPGIMKITGLDAAQPGFEGTDNICRLDKSDANFVELIHTNGLPFIPTLGFGYMFPAGDVDFYVNGGLIQPGCPSPPTFDLIKKISDLGQVTLEDLTTITPACNHERAHMYYTAALLPNCTIMGKKANFVKQVVNGLTVGYLEQLFFEKCDNDSCIPIGINSEAYPARGVFAATTSASAPFCENLADVDSIFHQFFHPFSFLSSNQDSSKDPTTNVNNALNGIQNSSNDLNRDVNSALNRVQDTGSKEPNKYVNNSLNGIRDGSNDLNRDVNSTLNGIQDTGSKDPNKYVNNSLNGIRDGSNDLNRDVNSALNGIQDAGSKDPNTYVNNGLNNLPTTEIPYSKEDTGNVITDFITSSENDIRCVFSRFFGSAGCSQK